MNPLRLLTPLRALSGRIAKYYGPVAAGARKPWLMRIVLALLALALLAAAVWLALAWLPTLPARFWQLFGLCAVALAVLWWFLAGRRRFALHGRTRKRIGDLGPGSPEDEREPLARMEQAIGEAKRTVMRSADMEKGRNPLYRVPWILFLGDADADTEGLLRAAAEVSPFPPPAPGDGGEVWRWWFFKSLIAVQMHPRVVCDGAARLERGLWYQALMLLARERELLPLNGIVVTVSVQTLLGPADALKTTATRLRRLVDEAMEHLQVQVPVYVVVSGLERLHGYDTVRQAVPAEAFAQALGHRLNESETVSAATSQHVDTILQPILDRLHALRMTALRTQATPSARRGVFEFGEALHRSRTGLSLLVTLLLEDNTFQRTPPWRGLYFAGAAGAAHPGGAFVADLFTRLLPADQPLATPSLRGRAGRLAVAGFGAAALLGFSAYLTHGLSAAREDDSRLLASTRTACLDQEGQFGAARIEWVASCGHTIEQLESAADRSLLGFGIRRADRDIEALRQQITDDFANLILAPYDQMLTQDIEHGRAGVEHALAIAQRLRLLEHCRRASDDCLSKELPHNVAFDARSRLFAPFVSAENDPRRDRDNANALFGAYLGYLRWQKKKPLNDERERLQAQLRELMQQQPLGVDGLRAWADAREPGLQLQDFWLSRERVVGVEPGTLPTLSAAFTGHAWKGVVAPLLDTAERNGVAGDRVKALRQAYFDAWFDEWARFQARFDAGFSLWRGHEDELLAFAAGADNPYQQYFRTLDEQLRALPLKWPTGLRWSQAWAEARSAWSASWRPLWRFLADSVRFGGHRIEAPAWLQALQHSRTTLLEPRAPVLARGYLQLQSATADADSYRIAADLFNARGNPAQAGNGEYAELLAAIQAPDEAYSADFSADDLAAWSIARGPPKLLLQLILRHAGEHLQQRWRDTVIAPLSALPPEQRNQALLAPQGRLDAFVADWLAPFLTGNERAPVHVAGIGLPLSNEFLALIGGSQRAPVVNDAMFPAGTFTLNAPSHLGTLREGPEGTTFEVVCGGRSTLISTLGESLSDAQTQVLWSPGACEQARIRISLPAAAAASPVPGPGEDGVDDGPDGDAGSGRPATVDESAGGVAAGSLRLTLLYPGADGFVRLFEDFAPGAHVFSISDFRDSYSPSQWQQLLPRLEAVGFRQARVHLQITASDEMNRYLASRTTAGTTIPDTILD